MSKPKSLSGANGRANLASTPSLSKEELALAGRRKLEEFRKKKAGEKKAGEKVAAAKKEQAAAMAAVQAIPPSSSSSSSSSAVSSGQVLKAAPSFTSRTPSVPAFTVEVSESSSSSIGVRAVSEAVTSESFSAQEKLHTDGDSISKANISGLGEAPMPMLGEIKGGGSKMELRVRAEAEEGEERNRREESKEREEREARQEREEREESKEREAREDSERKEREERERKARDERERKVRDESERKAKDESERKSREERERKALEERERKAQEERENKAREESERKAREERERKAREERERKSREERERKVREERERKVREEREKKAQEEREKKAREESERKAREDRERKAREEREAAKTREESEDTKERGRIIEKEEREREKAGNGATPTTASISSPKPVVRPHLPSPNAAVLPSLPNVFRPLRLNDLQTTIVRNLNGKESSPAVNEFSILEKKMKAGESMGAVPMASLGDRTTSLSPNRGLPVRLDSVFGEGPTHLGDGIGESNKLGIGAPSSVPPNRPPPPWLSRPKPPSSNVSSASPPPPSSVFRQHLRSTVSPPFPSPVFRPQLPSDHESTIVKDINGKNDSPVNSSARDNDHKEGFESKQKGSDRTHENSLTHSSSLNDFSALEQHIEDLTKEKFSLQHGLESARALSESLAQENSSLMDDFNTQGAAITQLKQEIERLRKEIQAQQLVLGSSRLERERAEDEKSSAVERSQTLAAEVIGLEEKVLRMRSQELKIQQSVDRLTSDLDTQKRAMNSLEKDRTNLRAQIVGLQEEKRNLQSRLRKAAVSGALKDMAGPSNSDVGSNRVDSATSTEDLEAQFRSTASSIPVSNAVTSVDIETLSSRIVEDGGEGGSEVREDHDSVAEPGPQTSRDFENPIILLVASVEEPGALPRMEEIGETGEAGNEGRGLGEEGEDEEPLGVPESASIRRVTSAMTAAFAAALATPGATWHQSFSMHIPEELDSLPEDDQRTVQTIDALLDEIRDERRALVRIVNSEAAASAELRAANVDLSRKLAIQTQRLELAVAQNMVASRSSTIVDNSTLDSLTYNREYIDEGDEVAERVLTWILRLFPGTRRSNSIKQ